MQLATPLAHLAVPGALGASEGLFGRHGVVVALGCARLTGGAAGRDTVVCESWSFVPLPPSLHLPWHQAHVVLVALSGLANINLALTLL